LLVVAVAGGVIGWLVRDWRLKIGAEPQTITAAQVAAQGPGHNHYVILLANSGRRPLGRSLGKLGHAGGSKSPVSGGSGEFASSIESAGEPPF